MINTLGFTAWTKPVQTNAGKENGRQVKTCVLLWMSAVRLLFFSFLYKTGFVEFVLSL